MFQSICVLLNEFFFHEISILLISFLHFLFCLSLKMIAFLLFAQKKETKLRRKKITRKISYNIYISCLFEKRRKLNLKIYKLKGIFFCMFVFRFICFNRNVNGSSRNYVWLNHLKCVEKTTLAQRTTWNIQIEK